MKIGIFDSGIGGLSVLYEALSRMPREEYIFYADTDHVPYGMKSSEEIKGYADAIVSDLINRGSEAVVIACNTATAVAAETVRKKYDIPIIGMEPAVKPALSNIEVKDPQKSRVLVMATPVTIRENKLHSLLQRLDKDHKVDLLPMPGFVRFAENEIFEGDEVRNYLEEQLAVFKKEQYSEVVLGCTHFNYFKPAICSAFDGAVELIDGNKGTVRHLSEILGAEYLSDDKTVPSDKNVTYLQSGRPADESEIARYHRLLDRLRLVAE